MSKQPSERTLRSELLGRKVEFNYSETWLAYSMLGLRVVIAWVFLQAGLEKLLEGGISDPLAWSSAFYLTEIVPETNPIRGVFLFFAEYGTIIDPLVIFGQLLIGLALLFGVFFRFAAMMGGLQMFFFWTAAWQGGLMTGFRVDHGYFVDSSLVYLLLLFGLGAWGAGRLLGVDRVLEETDIVRNNPWLRYVLG